MLLDRTHRSWAILSAVILAVATASYVVYAGMSPRGPTGGSLMGLIYGVVGSAFMIFAGLLAGRKQVPFWRLGSAQFWLRGHLWLGTLSVPLILFHAGFGLGGIVEQLLWAFFAIVVLSGFFGLAMQHLLPRLLTSQVPRETFGAQVPYVRKRNRLLSDRLVSTVCGRLPVKNDSLQPQLERLSKFAAELQTREKSAKGKAEKDEVREAKAGWTSQLDDDDSTLFRDVARFAKNSGWCRTENDFSTLLLDVYDFPGITPAVESAETETSPTESPQAGTPQAAAKGKPAAGLSPLEMMKAKQAATKSAPASEDIPATASHGSPAPASEDSEAPAKKLSPLDMIRSGGGAAAGGGKPAGAAAAKKASPLDQIRAGSAKGGAAGSAEDSPPPAKKLSPLDQIRKQSGGAAAKPAAAKSTAALASGEASADKPVVQKVAEGKPSSKPDPVPLTVADVDAEVDAVRNVLTEKYGYSAELAGDAASRTRAFLQTADQAAAAQAARQAAEQQTPAAADPAEKPAAPDVATDTDKPASPLDLIRKGAAAKSGTAKADAAADKLAGTSPLDMIRKGAAAKSGTAPSEAAADKPADKSPLDMIRKGAAAKSAASGDKPAGKSPLDMIRKGAAATKDAAATEDEGAADKPAGKAPKSPLDLMKAKAAAGAKSDQPAKPAPPKPPAPKKAAVKREILRTDELREFYLKTVRPFLAGSGQAGRLADSTESSRAFTQMRATLPVELHEILETLQQYCEEHRQFSEQQRIHRWLHYWLALHIPFSIGLLVLFVFHVLMSLRVVPWNFPFQL